MHKRLSIPIPQEPVNDIRETNPVGFPGFGRERDYAEMVMKTPRAIFVANCPMFFLVGRGNVVRPDAAGMTQSNRMVTAMIEAPRPMVLAVRKVQGVFASMITLGRTANNDLVVPDVSVSKVHAYFRQRPGGIEIADAGSSNGTWVGIRRLPPRGAALPVTAGETLRFGRVELMLKDAASCWDTVRSMMSLEG